MALAQGTQLEACHSTPRLRRVFTRVPFSRPVRWLAGADDAGTAELRDVSRAGVALLIAQYLRPGRTVHISFDGIDYEGSPIDVTATAVWCRPETAANDRFVAGFEIVQRDGHTLGAMSEVFYAAIIEYARSHRVR